MCCWCKSLLGLDYNSWKTESTEVKLVLWIQFITADCFSQYTTDLNFMPEKLLFSHNHHNYISVSHSTLSRALRIPFLFYDCNQDLERGGERKREKKVIEAGFAFFFWTWERALSVDLNTNCRAVWSWAPGRVLEQAFNVISILRGCLLSAGAIILL